MATLPNGKPINMDMLETAVLATWIIRSKKEWQ
jgi:hypothetical protein